MEGYTPLIRIAGRGLSKYLVVDIFAFAFSTNQVTVCFSRLNKSFHTFSIEEQALIACSTAPNSLANLLRMRMVIDEPISPFGKEAFFRLHKCPIVIKSKKICKIEGTPPYVIIHDPLEDVFSLRLSHYKRVLGDPIQVNIISNTIKRPSESSLGKSETE